MTDTYSEKGNAREGREATDRSAHGLNIHSSPTSSLSSFPTANVMPLGGMTPGRAAARLRAKLGERELAVLATLGKIRLATGLQLQRLHVTDGIAGGRPRRARALMKRLTELKLVVRLERQIGGIHAGSSGYLYGLSGYGQAVLALDGLHEGRRRREWEVGARFQTHVLMTTELYVRLHETARAEAPTSEKALELLDFQAEPPCWRHFPGPGGQTVTLKPDAFVRLAVGDKERHAFIEIDLGTESLATLVRKLGVYVDYWRTGMEQAREGVFPVVQWLTTNQRRADKIVAAIGRLPGEGRQLFRVGLLSEGVAVLSGRTSSIATAEAGRRG